MSYLTFAEYSAYGGGLTDSAFSRLEFKARMLIDLATFGRLKRDAFFREPVKRLMFELIGLIGNMDVASESYCPPVGSEDNDGYGVRFSDGSIMTVAETSRALYRMIDQYLAGEKNEAGEILLCRWA